ncbi:MAG: thiol:disulfide interchange protein DsbA/DsbL [Pseudomonadota bacterium]
MRTLSQLAFGSLLCLVLVACGGEQTPADPAAAAPETETVTEDASAEETATAAPELAAVEESDGSFDANEQAREVSLRMAQETTAAAPVRFKEGVHYNRFRPTKPTVGGGQGIEVAEIFWYGCNHCFNLEPAVARWKKDIAEDVSFVKMPAVWNPAVEKHAKLFYTVEALAGSGIIEDAAVVHQAIFDRLHVERRQLAREAAFISFLADFGVSKEAFEKAWGSFEVDTRMRQAKSLNRSYSIASVPTMIVNGKYSTDVTRAGSTADLFAVIDELVATER